MSRLEAEDTPIPEKCQGCGVQCELGAELMKLLDRKELAKNAGNSLVGEPGEDFDATIGAHLPEELAGSLGEVMRRIVGDDLGELDAAIEANNKESHDNELACSGVLEIQGSKDGVTYTVTLCTSPLQYMPDAPTLLPTLIRAEPEQASSST